MAADSKTAGGIVSKEIESRLKQSPEHLFEAFLEIREPVANETPEILIKYPENYSDEVLKSITNFAYPCKTPSDEQGEHFAFVVLDSTGTLFRFGYCRRSNRESTCLCIISFYPWFEIFYKILDDLSSIINSKSIPDVECMLSAIYNYKTISNEEIIEIRTPSKSYTYNRPDPRKLPSILSSRNFTVMVSLLGPELILELFSHLLFERRILFVSSKLFHLTACAYGCTHLIYPMHWQSIFLPILPSTMTWTTQCTAPYIIGLHSSLYSMLNKEELGDAVIVNIDERKIQSQYDDLSYFPKYLLRSIKKGIQQSSKLAGDHLSRVFLRAMAFTIGNYANGFVIRNDKLDFDRENYLEAYLGSHSYTYMSSIAQTQMFEQFSRYRTYAELQRETDIDEFDLEVKNLQKIQQSKKFKTNKKIYKILEKYIKDGTILDSSIDTQKNYSKANKRKSLIDTKFDRNKATNPLIEQVQNKAEKLHTVINKAGQRVASEASTVRNNFVSLDMNDLMKRSHNSKSQDGIGSNHFGDMKSAHQSSTPDLLNEQSIPYERLHSRDDLFSASQKITAEDRMSSSSSSDSLNLSTPELDRSKTNQLINLDIDEDDHNPLLPSPIVLNVINSSVSSPSSTQRATPQIDSKIRQLQNELQSKVRTFDNKRINTQREDSGQQKEIKKLVEQFDPLENSNDFFSPATVTYRQNDEKISSSSSNTNDRHPSIYETIPTNHVNNILQNIQSIYGTSTRSNLRATYSLDVRSQESNQNRFSPLATAPASLFPIRAYSTVQEDSSCIFDPLAPSNEKNLLSNSTSTPPPLSSETNGTNLIDFN